MKFFLVATLAVGIIAYPADKVKDQPATISMTLSLPSKTLSSSSSSTKGASTSVRVTSTTPTIKVSTSSMKTSSSSSTRPTTVSTTPSVTATRSSSSSFPSSTPKCYPFTNVTQAFYGFAENSWGGSTVFNCGRVFAAGGTGSFDDPVTFAGSPGEFRLCEVVYNPYLRKYLRNEDYCSHKNCPSGSIMIWTGTSVNGGSAQAACENKLAVKGQALVRNPARNLNVDTSILFTQKGGKTTCNTDATYKMDKVRDYCS